MARMYAKRKGKSGSTKPHNESLPEWSNTDAKAVTELVVEICRQAGHSSEPIGTILRDQHAVPDARKVLGKRISAVMAENGIGGSNKEDMMNLMRKAVGIIDHLGSGNHKDTHNKRSLELTEAKIRRLAKYYISEGRLSADWKYKRDELRLMVMYTHFDIIRCFNQFGELMKNLLQCSIFVTLENQLTDIAERIKSAKVVHLMAPADVEGVLSLSQIESALLDNSQNYLRRILPPRKHVSHENKENIPEVESLIVHISPFHETQSAIHLRMINLSKIFPNFSEP